MTTSRESDAKGGIDRVPGDEGLVDSRRKSLQLVNEALCLVPTEGTNCCYLDRLTSRELAAKFKLAKRVIQRRWASCLSND